MEGLRKVKEEKNSRGRRQIKQVRFAKEKERRSFMVAEQVIRFVNWIGPFVVALEEEVCKLFARLADSVCDRRQRIDTRPLAERSPQDRAQAARRLPPR